MFGGLLYIVLTVYRSSCIGLRVSSETLIGVYWTLLRIEMRIRYSFVSWGYHFIFSKRDPGIKGTGVLRKKVSTKSLYRCPNPQVDQ